MKRGRIIILSGPSGSGKTTLHQKLLKDPAFKRKFVKSLSVTTRAPRPGEQDGRDYFFINKKQFLSKQKKGEFLESMKVFDNYYGTPKDKVDQNLDRGKNVLLCIDVQGAAVVGSRYKDAVKIFIKTPSLKDLKARLEQRATEDTDKLKLRLKTAKEELKEAGEYDYVVINDVLNRAYRELARILKAEVLGAVKKRKLNPALSR
ncbi:MAG: guanylate kinase [Candidatus Omnitrophica bacterium]|nr:guanylate kinase [Candidatus Omnitrophota bacterium]